MANAVIRFPPGQSFTMAPNAVAYANAVLENTGADSFGTYAGHEPDPEHAVDCFSPIPDDRNGPSEQTRSVLGDYVADFAIHHMDEFGIWYVIWRQHIYNPSIANYWRQMEDRGGITNNHFDHVHASFYDKSVVVTPPKPITEEDPMALSVRFTHSANIPGQIGYVDWIFDGPSRIFAPSGSTGVLTACDACKMPAIGQVDDQTFQWFQSVASQWK